MRPSRHNTIYTMFSDINIHYIHSKLFSEIIQICLYKGDKMKKKKKKKKKIYIYIYKKCQFVLPKDIVGKNQTQL